MFMITADGWGRLRQLAFVLTTPVNRVLIGRGLGHAVVPEYHH